jgi:diaminopimelate epimerase
VPRNDRPDWTKTICDSARGIGADGVVWLEKRTDTNRRGSAQPLPRFAWDFYNSDGSKAEMCGNAARCAGLFVQKKFSIDHFELLTGAGLLNVRARGKEFQVEMTKPGAVIQDRVLQRESGPTTAHPQWIFKPYDFVNSGVPHAVFFNEDLDWQNPKSWSRDSVWSEGARTIQNHRAFQPEGTNVTLASEVQAGTIRSATFERGVAAFTRACGTGAVAAALCYGAKTGLTDVEVLVPGGTLHVDLKQNLKENLNGNRPLLTGPAVWVADLTIPL